jgi:hypothetical protein
MNQEGWLPIETAPQDGTRILAAIPSIGKTWEMNVVFFDQRVWEDVKHNLHKGAWVDVNDLSLEEPTHWMPLPEPPK